MPRYRPTFLLVLFALALPPLGEAQAPAKTPAQQEPAAEAEPPPARRLAIIVHRANQVPSMAEKEVRGIFQVERRFWFGTSPLVLVVQKKGSDTHEAFARRMLNASADELEPFYARKRELWKDLKEVASDAEAKALVKRDKRAVAYVWEESVDKSVRQVASIPLDVPPEQDSVDASVARLTDTMDNLRDLWDQLQASLRSPGVPDEDVVKMAVAVANFCEDVHRRAPMAKDPPSKRMNELATRLMAQTRKLPEAVLQRQKAIQLMGNIEKNTCMGCHRLFR